MRYSTEEIQHMERICTEYKNAPTQEFLHAWEYVQELSYWLGDLGIVCGDIIRGSHYVYMAFDGEQLVYVGSGKGDRCNHVTSGISHNKELNRMHFSGKELFVYKAFERITQAEALRLESVIIKLMNPSANTNCKVHNSFVRNHGSVFNAWSAGKLSNEKVLELLC